MGELSTYSLNDFFPFTQEVYFRLFVRLNESVWPLQILTVLLAVGALWFAWQGRGKIAGMVFGALWALVGQAFHIALYADLNWAAEYFGWAFILQGGLLLSTGYVGGLDAADEPIGVPEWIGMGTALFALIAFPVLGPLIGHEWSGTQLVGIAPDPTAIATFGLLLLIGRTRWWLYIIPVLWAAIAGATAWQMQDVLGLVTPAAALVAIVASIAAAISRRSSSQT